MPIKPMPAARASSKRGRRSAIVFVPACGVLFSGLQLYWGVLLLKMAGKALRPKPARAKLQ